MRSALAEAERDDDTDRLRRGIWEGLRYGRNLAGHCHGGLGLQSVTLQALVHKGVIARVDALGIVDRGLETAEAAPSADAESELAALTLDCLVGVRAGVVAMSERR
jgi:hypothetical protein